jgi:penicillin-binding protein 2
VKGSWRDRPSGSRFSRLWRPWSSLHPFRGQGRSINEPKTVGIRDLVAPPSQVTSRPERRWLIIGIFFAILLLVLIGRLYILQVVDYHQSVTAVENNALHVSNIPASRGQIYDRSGKPLVTNVTTVEIRLSRAEAANHPTIEGALASLTGQTVGQIKDDLHNQQYDPYQPAPIMSNAPPRVVEFIKLHPAEFPGVSVLDVSRRSYPEGGNIGAQVLGYVGPINGHELAAHPNDGYQTDSTIGKTGIEAFYEQYLRGHDGTSTIKVNNVGQVIGTLKTTQPRIGNSVVLNIDAGLQKALDGYLANGILTDRTIPDPRSGKLPPAINGAAVVLDPNTGAVLAMSSYPSYDLSSFVNGLTTAAFEHLLSEGAFNNYAIQGLYTPGSTFKMVTATAQMQTGILSPNVYLDDTGSFKVPNCRKVGTSGCVFHDDETTGNGSVDLQSALTKSSDYYFYNLGYLFWSQTGRYGLTPIQNVAHDYGLDQFSNIDLPDEVQGRVDSPTVRKLLHDEAPKAFPNVSWYTGDNIEMAFGQGATAITPIGLANAYATFANGGTRYEPEVAAAIVNAHGQTVIRYRPRILNRIHLLASERNPILQGLTGVVESPDGTAYSTFHSIINFSLASFPIAGKTGTASNQHGQEPNSLFVGFGPVGHPKYVVVCIIAQGGYGADAAAPVVARTFNYLVAHPIGPVKLKPQLTVSTTTTTTANATTTTVK